MSQFRDLIVLELASVLAGPGVGQFFAELGAQVIKVENLTTSGDITRSWKSADEKTDDRSAYFCAVNWGKQSIAVDLTKSEGRELVSRLAAYSHIVVASYKPGDAERLGTDYETLSRANPALIYGQITGYGSHNNRVGYDAIIQAEAGFMSMNGEPGGQSLKIPVALMDVLAGHHLKEGLLLALLEKQATGRGKLVEVSLIQAAVASLANQASNYLVAGKVPTKQGSAHPNIAPYGEIFRTSDDKELMLAVGTDKQFRQLADLLGISLTLQEADFRDNVSRVRHRKVLNRSLQEAIELWHSSDIVTALRKMNIPAGIINTVPDALGSPEALELLVSADQLKGIRTFVANSAAISSHLLPPPHLGEHTEIILQDMLKISPKDVQMLFERRIIG